MTLTGGKESLYCGELFNQIYTAYFDLLAEAYSHHCNPLQTHTKFKQTETYIVYIGMCFNPNKLFYFCEMVNSER
jgi:hypothetical protein